MLLPYRRYVAEHPFVRLLPRRMRRNAFLLQAVAERCYRLLCRPTRIGPMLHDKARGVRRRIRPPFSAKAAALATARAVGGSVPLPELERVWEASARCRRAVCIAEGQDLLQLNVVLSARGVAVVPRSPLSGRGDTRSVDPVDLVITLGVDAVSHAEDPQAPSYDGAKTLRLICEADDGRHSAVHGTSDASAECTSGEVGKISAGSALKVLLLNDWGFQYGAGSALKRQAASFLLNGWEVAVIAWQAGGDRGRPTVVGSEEAGGWHGLRTLGDPDKSKGYDSERLVAEIKARLPFRPDVVVLGNTHAAGWPVDLPARLGELGAPVVAYMHDCYWVTGRCAYPGPCTLFRTGCDASCPTAGEYPALASEKIAPAWRQRSAVFTGNSKVSLLANSRWTFDLALQRYGSAARAELVHLGVDHRLFAPLPKSVVRRILGLPADKLLVAMGAASINNPWKGGPIFETVYRALRSRDDVGLLLFGWASGRLASTRSFGLIDDERLMPLVYNAADIYLTTATAEAFGQTLLEASACAVPVVAFKVGGIADIVTHEKSGLLVEPPSVPDLLAAVERLLGNRKLREQMGRNGRARVENNFTLDAQAERWNDYLMQLRKEVASEGSSFSAMPGSVA